MKRIERPSRVIYADRRLALALVCLYLSGIGVALPFFFTDIVFVWGGSVFFGFLGLKCLFHRRDFVIDRGSRDLTVITQRVFRSRSTTTYKAGDLKVRVVSVPIESPGPTPHPKNTYQAWVVEQGELVQLLTEGRDLGAVQALAQGFARDLGRPCLENPAPVR